MFLFCFLSPYPLSGGEGEQCSIVPFLPSSPGGGVGGGGIQKNKQKKSKTSELHCNRRLDARPRMVPHDLDVFEPEREEILHGRIELERREWTRRPRQLFASLVEVIDVQVRVAERVDEVADLQITYLCDHVREEAVAGDVERHPEEHIGAPLIQLTTQRRFSACAPWRDIKLEQAMTRRERHRRQIPDVPR